MQILDESQVLASEIDSLGHMNVRFYLSRVDRANNVLLDKLGVTPAPGGATVRRHDTYSRFRREQFAGATLHVAGGLLESDDALVRCYFEIRNPAKNEIAATFIVRSGLVDPTSQQALALPPQLNPFNEQYGTRLPEHGMPRSLSLDPPRMDVSLEELTRRVSQNPTPGMMSGRRESVVDAEDCDANGFLKEDVDLMFAMHKPQPGQQSASFGPPVMRTANGHRFSWAMIETRAIVLGRPRAGDRIVSLGADVALGERWRQSRRWAFVAETGRLVGINDVIGMALDLDERRSITIPDDLRASIERDYLPDLI
ncbi:MAG TPA: thioesterase family protein [Pseudomonadales bacterium]